LSESTIESTIASNVPSTAPAAAPATTQAATVIKVIGVGGAGGNAVNHMAASGLADVEFICANTDAQALASTGGATRIQLGDSGLGAGSDPLVGREAATRERARIAEVLKGAHMVFITAGMGGGTGTGAAPIVAEVAREMGILTVGVVSKPFSFEGARRMRVADDGIDALMRTVDSLVIVLNSRLEEVLGDDITQKQAFAEADEVLSKAVAGIAEIIKVPGMINVDFEDVRTVMRQLGTAMMGTATHAGEERAVNAAQEAIACPLLAGADLSAARGLLVNIAASQDTLKLRETKQVMTLICAQTSEDAIIKFGAVFDETLGDALRVTVVATGLSPLPADVERAPDSPRLARMGAPGGAGGPGQFGGAPARPGLREAPGYPGQRQNGYPAPQPNGVVPARANTVLRQGGANGSDNGITPSRPSMSDKH
jgi:cell division protein FtsZ